MRATRVTLLTLALLGAGCVAAPAAQKQNCFSTPSTAWLHVAWPGDEDAFLAALAEEGWNVTAPPPGYPPIQLLHENAFATWMAREEPFLRAHVSGETGPDGNLTAGFNFRGYAGSYTKEEAERDLAPVVEPLAARFDGIASYQGGFNPCDLR